jgi:trimethylamine monooxygenase
VEYSEDSKQFTVTAHDLLQDRVHSEVFDYVVVATGHFSFPNIPYFSGFESFNGRILHAHDFRDALEFKDKTILIVGSSYSAEDIGSQCYKYGAKAILVSYRSEPMGYHWPANWKEVPLLTHVKNNTAFFKDGTSYDVDAIILCTGYRHHFPFLPDTLRLKTGNRLWPLKLYKGIVWESNPRLIYLGMQDQYYTFNMFDAQAWYARDVILDRITIPSQEKMEENSLSWRKREEKLLNAKEQIEFQGAYVKDLLAEVDYPYLDVDGVNEAFMRWKQEKKEDIMGYRDKTYHSLITGNQSPLHHTAWLTELDDSRERFLSSGSG